MTEGPLLLAVPSKGRLQENAAAFFARAGLAFTQARGARDYRGAFAGVPDVEILFLSAGETVAQLGGGVAHLGISGEDLLREKVVDAEGSVELITGLGFGQADVVVAVPQAWIDVRTMADLDEVADDLRARHGRRLLVATKYMNLTRRFFAEKGLSDYRIVESLGATEGAPASGAADLIVDITTTGATLVANGLRVLDDGTILRSEANLMASLKAPWGARARAAARTLLSRIAAEETARTTREVRGWLDPSSSRAVAALAARAGARVSNGPANGSELVIRCPRGTVFGLVDALVGAGARDVTVRALDYAFDTANPLLDRLLRRLGDPGS